jgi:hypothetical protein
MKRFHAWRVLLIAAALATLTAASCDVSKEAKIRAMNAVNEQFRTSYEGILAESGTRVVAARRDEALVAMRSALAGMGMQLESQNPNLGVFIVVGKAPRPLDDEEWARVSAADEPLLRQLAEPHVGAVPTWFLHFEPKGLMVVISVTMLEVPEGTSVSLTARLREVAPPESDYPRREYLSPTTVRAGLDKIWAAMERELAAAKRAS